MRVRIILISTLQIFCFFTFAQNSKFGLADPNLTHKVVAADQLLLEKSYFNAIDEYQAVWAKEMKNVYVNHQLATCHYKTRNYPEAVRYYANTIGYDNQENRAYLYDLFYYAESLKSLGEYENAKVEYIKFYKQKIKTVEFKEFTSFAKQGIKGCDYALEKMKRDSTYNRIIRLENDINHAYSEFSPTVSGGDLYFASLRKDTVITHQYGDDVIFPMRIFISKPVEETWGQPSEFDVVNAQDAHAANPTFSSDGKTMYFSKCWNTRHNDIYCQIYSNTKDELGEWQKPQKMHHKVNSHSFTSTQPNYATVITTTSKKSDTLNYLYFVSNRTGGFGGNDLWYSIIDNDGKPSTPINCGKKINSSRDEITPFYEGSTNTLYFSSNYHTGFGGYDVFSSKGKEAKWAIPVNLDLPINSSLDDTYYQTLAKKDNLNRGLIASNRPGGFALKHETCCEDIYSVAEYVPAFINMGVAITHNVTAIDSVAVRDSIQIDSAKKKVWAYSSHKIGVSRDTIVPLQGAKIGLVQKIYADEAKKFGKFTPAGLASKTEWLDTNNTGVFNAKLLKDKDYVLVILKDGMDPVLQDFSSDTDKNFAFQLLKTKPVVKDTLPVVTEITGSLAQIEENQEVKTNQKFLLENMYFDTDKDLIKDASLPSLELLLDFMEARPKVTVEIAGHTDSQGTDEHNLDLSQRRAESVKKYMIAHGIKEKRMIPKGYGEVQPIAPNETSEGRQLNRRTEIIILTTE